MRFHQNTAEIYVPDGLPLEQALARTTHMAIAAHQDDLEIMAAAPILACYQQEDAWFTGVVASDGRGSPRAGLYADYDDEQMRVVRFQEQKKAAIVGEYAGLALLDYPSRVIKDTTDQRLVEDLLALFQAAQPQFVYTHNLADKHDTHVSVVLRTIAALRRLPKTQRPQKLYGCEVWRDLDWLIDRDKVPLDLSQHENLQAALLGVFDSQISGGKRYDLATLGRRRANATYFETHGVDQALGLSFAMDLTPLLVDPPKEITAFVQEFIQRFAAEVNDRLGRLG